VLAFRLDWWLFGPSALGFHASGLAAYLVLVHVAHVFARSLLGPRFACVAASLFAVHPLHAENVASLVGRADVLALLLTLLALLRRHAAPWQSAALYVAAVGCKESALVLPLVIAVMGLAESGPSRRRSLILAGVTGTLGTLLLGLRIWLIPSTFDGSFVLDDVLRGATFADRLVFGGWVVGASAQLVFWPYEACTGRKYAEVARPEPSDPLLYLGLSLVLAALALATRDLARRRPPLSLLALVTLAPVSGVFFSMPEAMADRYLLAPGWFAILAATRAAERWLPAPLPRPSAGVLRAATGGILLLWLLAAMENTWAWRSTEAVLQQGVRNCPRSVHNRVRWARTLHDRGEATAAAWHFAVAAEARRHFPGRFEFPGMLEETELSPAERLREAHRLLGVEEPESTWRHGLAEALQRLGYPDEAALVGATPAPPLP
jgi:hypothetical protein